MKKILLYIGGFAFIALLVWVFLDPLWVDIWVFNKEIIMTNLAKWIPVAIMWSFADNMIDRLFHGTKMEKWMKKLFVDVS